MAKYPPTAVVSYRFSVMGKDSKSYDFMIAELGSDRLSLLKDFRCDSEEQDRYLQEKAWNEQRYGLNKTLLFLKDGAVWGYVTYGTYRIHNPRPKGWHEEKGISDYGPEPVLHIGQFAIARPYQGMGLGSELLRFVKYHLVRIAFEIGTVGISLFCVMDDKGERRVSFYERNGFSKLSEKPSDDDRIQMFYPFDKVFSRVYV